MSDYHVSDADLVAYAEDGLDDAAAWSVEAHLDRCGRCRVRVRPAWVADRPAPAVLPAPGQVRPPTRLRKVGLLVGAGPGARLAWLLALAMTVLLAVGATAGSGGRVPSWLLLLIAPVLPVGGTAMSYGRHTDPLHELVGSTAYGGLRILLWRTVSVLAVSVPVTVAAGFASGLGTPVLWLLPAVALTGLTLALAGPVEPARAATAVGLGWTVLVLGTDPGSGALVAAASGPIWGAVIVVAAVLIFVRGMRQEVFR